MDQLLLRTRTDRYPHGLAAAVLLSLDAVRAGDGTGVCSAVMDLISVLSAAGVPRPLLYAAGQAGALTGQEQAGEVPPDVVDEALGRLAGSSLLTFSVDGGTVTAHRLVMRVIRERLARQGHLTATCQAAAAALEARAESLCEAWQDRLARRDLVEQIMAVYEHAASSPGEAGSELTRAILRLRSRAVWFLNDLGDSAAQAIQVAEPLLADRSGSSAPTTPTPWPPGTTSPPPTRTRAGPPRRSRCMSAPSPTASGSSAPTTPTPWPPGTTSPTPTGWRAGPPRRSRCMSAPSPTVSGSSAPTTPTP